MVGPISVSVLSELFNNTSLHFFMCAHTQDSTPRGVIRLLPSGWIKAVPQGTPRMPDAIANLSEQNAGIISVVSVSQSTTLILDPSTHSQYCYMLRYSM